MSSITCYELDKEKIKKRITAEDILSEEMEKDTLSKNSEELKVESSTKGAEFPKFMEVISISLSFNQTKRILTQDVIDRIKWIKSNQNKTISNYEKQESDIDYQDIKNSVLNLITKKPNITTEKIIELTKYDTWIILEILDELREEGSVE